MNSSKRTRLLAVGAALAAMVALPHTASAVAFTGQIDYTGTHQPNNTDLLVATETQILLNFVVINTESFSLIPLGSSLTHASPVVWSPAGATYTPLWFHAASGIAFDLTSFSVAAGATSNLLSLVGTGTFYCTNLPCNFDATPGQWNMTLNNQTNTVQGSFSSTSIAIPEPGTLALLGLGLLGFGFAGRRRAA